MPRRTPGTVQDIVVGVDIGGSRTKVGAVGPDGALRTLTTYPASTGNGRRHPLVSVRDAIDSTINETGIRPTAVGVGIPGPANLRSGVVANDGTLSGWSGVDLKAELAECYGVPIAVENDADAAALGEYQAGAGRGATPLLVVNVGTGIGVSILIDGHIYRGVGGIHPELGHHVIDPSGPPCYCGAAGCWEVLAAAPAIVSAARRHELSASQAPTAEAVARAARRRNPVALRAIGEVGQSLATGLVNAVLATAPQVVVLTGAVMNSYDLFTKLCASALARRGGMLMGNTPRLRSGKLGDSAGVIGAAVAARYQWQARAEAEAEALAGPGGH